ncbi:MAG: hypothetical protein AB1607_15375 [Chloroflexota bacterium]
MDRTEILVREIRASAGFRVQNELELLSDNFYAFDINYKHWKKYLSNFKNTESLLKLWDQKNRAGFMLTLNELTRLLLNFLASATSLVSVTRNSVPIWYQHTDFAKEYEVKKEKLAKDDECRFIEDLRNYSQHHRLPFARGKMQLRTNELTGQFVLNRNMLNSWDGWAKGKTFLKGRNEDVDLESLIDSYYNKILDFHKWIFARIQEINSEEIRKTEVLQEELENLLNKIFDS